MKIYQTPSPIEAAKFVAQLISGYDRDIDKKIYVFCQSKATFTYEREIVRTLGGTFNVEVLSFARYLSKNIKVNYLSKAQAGLLCRKLMKDNQDHLERIKPVGYSVYNDVYGLIAQLKAACITPNDLVEVINSESGILKSKLSDIAFIFEKYEEYLANHNLTDESTYLSFMVDAIKSDQNLIGAKVVISDIQSFTKQTLNIVKTLGKLCDVDFVCVTANYPAFTNESINKISGLFPQAPIVELDRTGVEEKYRIAQGLFEPLVYTKLGKFSDRIKINEASSVQEECNKIALRIRYEVINSGYRYKDFAVICPNLLTISPNLKKAFYLYDIPYYQDESTNLDKHPVIGLIGGLIDLKRFNYLPKKAITLSKNVLINTQEESQSFINYILENAISRKQFLEPFSELVAESVRNKLMFVCQRLKNKDSVNNYISIIKDALDYLGVYSRGDELTAKLTECGEGAMADFNKGGLNAIGGYLDQISQILGNITIPLAELKNIILTGAGAIKISGVQQYNDTVYVGDFSGGRLNQSKIVFVPELSFDVPKYKSDVALLNDHDLTKMEGYKLVIEPKLQIVNERERENILISLMSFTEQLYLSYSLTDINGKPIIRSQIIDQIINIFSDSDNKLLPNNKPIDKSQTYLNYLSTKAGRIYAAKHAREFKDDCNDDITDVSAFLQITNDGDLERKILDFSDEQIFNPELCYTGKLSATAIENYFSCPYKAFAGNVLHLVESPTGETKVYEFGNILHGVMENFVNNFDKVTFLDDCVTFVDKLFDEQIKIPLYARYLNKPQFKHIFRLLKLEAEKECLMVYNDINNSDFKPLGAEIGFFENAKNGPKPIYLDTEDGRSVALRGKIDRVDVFSQGNDKYFRIIDYKTGSVSTNDNDFYMGKKLQLYLYMNVFTKLGYKPAGAYYLKLSDDYTPSPIRSVDYYGKTLKDAEMVGHLDNTFKTAGESTLLKVIQNKDGSLRKSSALLTPQEFSLYLKYSIDVAKTGANEMSKGCFKPSPTLQTCDHCYYKGLCGYDQESGKFNREVVSTPKPDDNKEEIDE